MEWIVIEEEYSRMSSRNSKMLNSEGSLARQKVYYGVGPGR